ncbi:MAG: hypothetical protein ACKVJX_24610, partial [Verrucomicrobiia bacterium]
MKSLFFVLALSLSLWFSSLDTVRAAENNQSGGQGGSEKQLTDRQKKKQERERQKEAERKARDYQKEIEKRREAAQDKA